MNTDFEHWHQKAIEAGTEDRFFHRVLYFGTDPSRAWMPEKLHRWHARNGDRVPDSHVAVAHGLGRGAIAAWRRRHPEVSPDTSAEDIAKICLANHKKWKKPRSKNADSTKK